MTKKEMHRLMYEFKDWKLYRESERVFLKQLDIKYDFLQIPSEHDTIDKPVKANTRKRTHGNIHSKSRDRKNNNPAVRK